MKKVYYVYVYIDPRNDIIFYVGKGNGSRYKAHLRPSLLKAETTKNKIIKELMDEGMTPIIEKIKDYLTEQEALNYEQDLISEIGFENLTNQTTGGQGVSGKPSPNKGKKMPEEQRIKLSESRKGKNNPMFGKTRSKESIEQGRLKIIGNQHWLYGRTHTSKTKEKIRQTLTGRKLTDNQKRLRSDNMKEVWEKRKSEGSWTNKNKGKSNPSYKHIDDNTIQRMITAYTNNKNKIPMVLCKELNISWHKYKAVLIEHDEWKQ
jgi:hypothetical protein